MAGGLRFPGPVLPGAVGAGRVATAFGWLVMGMGATLGRSALEEPFEGSEGEGGVSTWRARDLKFRFLRTGADIVLSFVVNSQRAIVSTI